MIDKEIDVINLCGKEYITTKEACSKYGLSRSWFDKARCRGTSPSYIKLSGKGKIFYPVPEIDEWFIKNIRLNYE